MEDGLGELIWFRIHLGNSKFMYLINLAKRLECGALMDGLISMVIKAGPRIVLLLWMSGSKVIRWISCADLGAFLQEARQTLRVIVGLLNKEQMEEVFC